LNDYGRKFNQTPETSVRGSISSGSPCRGIKEIQGKNWRNRDEVVSNQRKKRGPGGKEYWKKIQNGGDIAGRKREKELKKKGREEKGGIFAMLPSEGRLLPSKGSLGGGIM